VDAKGNKICYQYDAIHRNIGITYPSSGPDASVTQSKTFVYDSATYNGTSMLNPKGRLVEAYTGASGSKTTDEFFQYSVRGELTDTWECTPHSGTNGCASVSNYYHVTAGFWANGALNTLNSNISGLPNQTYGVDGMGRANAVSASAGQTPLVNGASTSYGLYQSTVTYGSGDSDVVSLDPNTGRMTQYVFNVGSQNVTGNLTWNSDGSLLKLVITNQLNTLDTQTCGYTRDDLSRISSVGCANGSTNRWNQQFTYDAFGNITKTVPVGGTGTNFQPTYSSSSNWITALPGATPLTDANGQMTNDGAHTYTWDAEHKMHSVDANPSSCSTSGECLTYDALGRMVEKTVGSTYTQIVYGPQGRFATMNGQTLVKAFIPLPGSQAVYTSASLNTSNKVAYYRHTDHLGSSRLATTPTQTLYSSTAYGPYGEPYSQSGATDLSFTGQEQDTVSGIYDFPARKYPPVQGRWLSPDPAGLAAANPANPQSWNRYAYVLNNPMSLVDPLGLDPCDTDSGGWQCFTQPPQPSPPVGPFGGPCMGSGGGSQNGTCDPGEPGPPWGPGCTSNGVCVAPGGGGGGPSSLLALIGKPVMPHNPLADCTQDLFGVTMDSFVQSQIGEDGSFTGTTAGVFQGFRVPAAPGPYAFTVNFDATTHNSGQITDMYVEIMGPVPANTFVYGVTPSTNPFHAYVALDLPPTGPNVLNMQAVQLWELGNALSVITGKQWPQNLNVQPGPNNNEPGNVLTNCVQQHGG
jgi:RHS repeat-associated protein